MGIGRTVVWTVSGLQRNAKLAHGVTRSFSAVTELLVLKVKLV